MGDEIHARLGFSIAFVLIVLAWNFDWRHYIRYYGATAGKRKRALFRIFCLLCLIGGLGNLIRELFRAKWTFEDMGYSLLITLMTLAAFGALDAISRWRLGPVNRSDPPD